MIGYQYDAYGNRVGKGTVTTIATCDITANGYQPMTDFVLDQSGGQMTEMAVSNTSAGTTYTWTHSNVTAGGALIASFDTTGYGLHFYLNDALGSRRVQTDPAGIPEQTCQSLPFGDQLYCTGSPAFPTEHHFTGKERDAESGLDYFGARYLSSNMGRFSSPDDPAGMYVNPSNPQSWNLYSYVQNNPLNRVDPDGHDCVTANSNGTVTINSGDCSGKDANNEYYVNCDGCLMGTTSVNWTPQGDLQLNGPNSITVIDGVGGPPSSRFDNPYGDAVFGPQSASTWNNAAGVTNAAATPLMVFLAVAVPGILEGSLPAAGLGIGGVGAAGVTGAHSDYADVTTGKSIPNSQTNLTPKQFGENLEANGFSKQTKGNVTIYTKGDTQYTVYPRATSTGGPTAQVKVAGEVVGKIRLQ